MKRLSFITAAGAAALAGCSGHGTVPQLLHGGGSTGPVVQPPAVSGFRMIPAAAPTIPEAVLKAPLVAEAWRFDGMTPPSGWAFLQGQQLRIDAYPALYSVIGDHAKRATPGMFTLPKAVAPSIVALNGSLPSSPSSLARLRPANAQVSLGPGARPAPPKQPKAPRPDPAAAQARAAAIINVRASSAQSLGDGELDALQQTRARAQSVALQSVGGSASSALSQNVAAVLNGRQSVRDAIVAVSRSLSASEAARVLDAHDEMQRHYSRAVAARGDAAYEAAAFLVAGSFTREQAVAISERE